MKPRKELNKKKVFKFSIIVLLVIIFITFAILYSNNDNFRKFFDKYIFRKEVNSENAYSFFKTYHSRSGGKQLNSEAFSLYDPLNKITAKSVSKAMKALLEQAKQMGLENSPEFENLSNEIQRFEWLSEESIYKDPSAKSASSADKAINNLLIKMGARLEYS
jgi:hypothetical protein